VEKKLLCTLGPSSLNESVISRLGDLGVSLFRINLSHTQVIDLPETIDFIQAHTTVPICLDTEGAQVRNGSLEGGQVALNEHMTIRATRSIGAGTAECFSFYPDFVVDLLEVGDFISIDFNAVLVQVIERNDNEVVMRILNGGIMGQNKAVTIGRSIELPPLTSKDREAIAIGLNKGISHFALSFASSGANVDLIRNLCGSDSFIISKIESRDGLANLDEITNKSDAILIDRGDLSREVPIEQIPGFQKHIIRNSNAKDTPVYVATNLLESMITQPGPTRAEVNDVVMTLDSGADGLVLAAETAVGRNPIACANMIVKLVHAFESKDDDPSYMAENPKSLLVSPHGGRLVSKEVSMEDMTVLDDLRHFEVSPQDLMDCEQIANGTYSPLRGFMDKETLNSVLVENQLPNGIIWTMPIVLQFPNRNSSPAVNERVILTGETGKPHSLFDVTEVYSVDLSSVAKSWFGTNDLSHPGVARFMARGSCFVAGEVTLIERRASVYREFELTPTQTRFIFSHKGWSRVVGFHTRNPAHRVHEYIQLSALSQTHADGLYISPVIGPKKEGDFLPGPILRSYQTLIQDGVYPEGKVVMGSFSTYSRFCGPREAVFTALARKNMGCSHFIVGRDHTGVGNYYTDSDNKRLFESIGDLGITPVFFDAIGYHPEQNCYLPQETPGVMQTITGTEARNTLRNEGVLPDWFMRHSVQDLLRRDIKSGEAVFQ
jgi:pyruvate kinase